MTDIVLTTLNARYTHASLGLRYLYANLDALQTTARIQEFTISMRALDIVEQLLENKAKIIGFGVYIWNACATREVIALLRVVAPDIVIVVGGPEVSYETTEQEINRLAHYTITGAGETSFRQLCEQLLTQRKPLNKVINGIDSPLKQLNLPYQYYDAADLRHRFIYVEAARGCPFKCEFCLSSLDKTAYPFELDDFLSAMDQLWQRGLRNFKFVDRTFNLKISSTLRILDFFLERLDQETFLHFELIPDHLPDKLKACIQRFPAGSLQFEVGIQSFNPAVQALISRKQDNAKSKANLRWLREESNAYLHTDLIFGLPGEDLESFAAGFNTLVSLRPHEIQVGILKRLRGTPIIRHTQAYQMVYNPEPPYNILSNDRVDYATMQRMNRFARYWDMIANSGRFSHALPLLLGEQAFQRFWQLSAAIYQHSQQTHKIALPRLFKWVHQIGLTELAIPQEVLETALVKDYAQTGQKGRIPFLPEQKQQNRGRSRGDGRNQRQRRHADA